jgi:hypothetical protein
MLVVNNTAALVAVPETARPSVCATGNGLLELTAVPPLNIFTPASNADFIANNVSLITLLIKTSYHLVNKLSKNES